MTYAFLCANSSMALSAAAEAATHAPPAADSLAVPV